MIRVSVCPVCACVPAAPGVLGLTGRTYTRTEVPYYTEVTTEAPLSHSWPLNTWPECPRNQEEDTHCGCTSASIRCGKSRDVCMCFSLARHTLTDLPRADLTWVVTWSHGLSLGRAPRCGSPCDSARDARHPRYACVHLLRRRLHFRHSSTCLRSMTPSCSTNLASFMVCASSQPS